MSLVYAPINGSAGSVIFTLTERSSDTATETYTLSVVGFEEEDVESESTEYIENILGETIKDYYGFKKKINFGLVNGIAGDSRVLGSNNLSNILNVVNMINLANLQPTIYKLSIQYRTQANGYINDAIQVGNFKLQEISGKANTGQTVYLEFISNTLSDLDYSMTTQYGDLDLNNYLALEDGGRILLENGNQLLAER